MTTIILTLIGILLAAVATLMIVYYGGDVYGVGQTSADASTLANAGTNVIMAAELYKVDNFSYPDGANSDAILTKLLDRYLDEDPSLPSDLVPSYSSAQYRVTNVSQEVCERVNVNLKNGAIVIGDGKMGCIDGTFYANY